MFVGEKFSQQYFGLKNNEDSFPVVEDDVSLVPILWGVIYCNPHLTLVIMERTLYWRIKETKAYLWMTDYVSQEYCNAVFMLLRRRLLI